MIVDNAGIDQVTDQKEVSVSGRWLRIARLADEWFDDVESPEAMVAQLQRMKVRADIFTFWQRLPETEPRYRYQMEWDSLAVLPVTTYENWYKKQINNKTRNLLVKAHKKGVEVRPASFDDEFVRGMTAIFNETPMRQERTFLHYGKSFETVKAQFSRNLFREELYGAYFGEELIGFIFLANAGRFMYLGQIISLIRHRDKSPQNALMARAVEVCAEKRIPYLVYALWPNGPLREFKRHNAFECVNVPRYYIPLSAKGKAALRLGLHHGAAGLVPAAAVPVLKAARSRFYSLKYRSKSLAPGNTPPA